MKKTLIFDLDGTLLDSLKDIALGMNRVLSEFGFDEFRIERYRYFVGGGVDVLSKNVLSALDVEFDFKILSKRFKEVYESALHANTKPYDGIEELLANLKGENLAILSNKPHEITKLYAQKFFSNYGFGQVYGQRENIPKKPNPNTAKEIALKFNAKCEDVYFIGDTKVDMQTAKNANMKSIGVLWGFRDEKELRENGADFIVSHPKEIADILA